MPIITVGMGLNPFDFRAWVSHNEDAIDDLITRCLNPFDFRAWVSHEIPVDFAALVKS